MVEDAYWPPLFDDLGFAQRVRAAAQAVGGVRRAAALAHVSPATVSRAAQGWPQLSHENYLRLSAWLSAQPQEQERAA